MEGEGIGLIGGVIVWFEGVIGVGVGCWGWSREDVVWEIGCGCCCMVMVLSGCGLVLCFFDLYFSNYCF